VPVDSRRQHEEYSMAVALGTIRLMAGSTWSPVEVQFQHPAPADVSELLRVFGAPVTFGHDDNALVVDDELCERQVPAATRGSIRSCGDISTAPWRRCRPRTVSSNPCAGRSGSPSGMAIRRSAGGTGTRDR